jgi:hypothetical protein
MLGELDLAHKEPFSAYPLSVGTQHSQNLVVA